MDAQKNITEIGNMSKKGLEHQLRQAIIKSGLSQYELGDLSGVNRAQINRFVRGERTLTLESAEKIVDALGLELKPKAHKKGR